MVVPVVGLLLLLSILMKEIFLRLKVVCRVHVGIVVVCFILNTGRIQLIQDVSEKGEDRFCHECFQYNPATTMKLIFGLLLCILVGVQCQSDSCVFYEDIAQQSLDGFLQKYWNHKSNYLNDAYPSFVGKNTAYWL